MKEGQIILRIFPALTQLGLTRTLVRANPRGCGGGGREATREREQKRVGRCAGRENGGRENLKAIERAGGAPALWILSTRIASTVHLVRALSMRLDGARGRAGAVQPAPRVRVGPGPAGQSANPAVRLLAGAGQPWVTKLSRRRRSSLHPCTQRSRAAPRPGTLGLNRAAEAAAAAAAAATRPCCTPHPTGWAEDTKQEPPTAQHLGGWVWTGGTPWGDLCRGGLGAQESRTRPQVGGVGGGEGDCFERQDSEIICRLERI